jgi:hypothetical protein
MQITDTLIAILKQIKIDEDSNVSIDTQILNQLKLLNAIELQTQTFLKERLGKLNNLSNQILEELLLINSDLHDTLPVKAEIIFGTPTNR